MSLSLSGQVNSIIKKFCDNLAEKYNLDSSELFSIWTNEDSKTTDKKEKEIIDMTPEKAMSSTKDFLMAYCKSKGLKQSGKKEEIIDRVLEFLKKDKTEKKVEKSTSSKEKTEKVLSSISEKVGSIEIRKNKFNNYEHYESGLVFNNETKIVIGFQNSNGKVDALTDEKIELCKKYKFQYKLPENLSVAKGLNTVKVDELDEEELDDDDIEEEEELDEVDLEDD